MKIIKTALKDLLIIEPTIFGDDRGWFYESYSRKNLGLDITFVQDNRSKSVNKGVLRGLHLQTDPFAQTKLITCTRGAILDVVVDLREGSPSYLKHFKIELTEENKKQLLVPQGFAHGFITLVDNTEVQYKVDNYYSKEHDRSIKYNDPIFKIEWPNIEVILSEKDTNAPLFKDSDVKYIYKEENKI